MLLWIIRVPCGWWTVHEMCLMFVQCMSNVPPLTEYMLSDQWNEELNCKNPLGMHGEIAKTYAALVRSMWCGNNTCAVPRNFKVQLYEFSADCVCLKPSLFFRLDQIIKQLSWTHAYMMHLVEMCSWAVQPEGVGGTMPPLLGPGGTGVVQWKWSLPLQQTVFIQYCTSDWISTPLTLVDTCQVNDIWKTAWVVFPRSTPTIQSMAYCC